MQIYLNSISTEIKLTIQSLVIDCNEINFRAS